MLESRTPIVCPGVTGRVCCYLKAAIIVFNSRKKIIQLKSTQQYTNYLVLVLCVYVCVLCTVIYDFRVSELSITSSCARSRLNPVHSSPHTCTVTMAAFMLGKSVSFKSFMPTSFLPCSVPRSPMTLRFKKKGN